MKILFLFFLLMCTQLAFASKARMIALGQNASEGSYYVDDSRNIFKNPATINHLKNYFITEWGTASDSLDSNSSPHAEGGIIKEFGNFVYGLYLGSEVDSYNEFKTGSFLKQDNRVDMFFAGDAGVEWAAHLFYANNFDQSSGFDKSNEGMGFGFGLNLGNMGGHANIVFKDLSEGANASGDTWERDLSYEIGGTYRLGMFTLFAEYAKGGFTQDVSSDDTTVSKSTIVAGIGVKNELEGNSRFLFDISFENDVQETDGATSSEQTVQNLPILLGFESQVKEWLVLRGSVKQNFVIGNTDISGVSQSNFNSTYVFAGTTFIFDKVKIDGVIGRTTYSRVGTEASHGVLALDNLLTRVSLSYWF